VTDVEEEAIVDIAQAKKDIQNIEREPADIKKQMNGYLKELEL